MVSSEKHTQQVTLYRLSRYLYTLEYVYYTHIHIYVTTGEEWAMNLKENQGKQVPWEGLEGGNGGGNDKYTIIISKKKIKYLRRGGRAE